MSDDYDFGTLRSLLAATTRDGPSFDDIVRHLINWSWLDDPRVFERWLGYAEAHIGKWPDAARSLTVGPQDEIFLRDVFEWSTLFRSVDLRRVPGFFERFLSACEEGHFAKLRHLRLDTIEPSEEQAGRLLKVLQELEGLSLKNSWGSTSALSSFTSIFGQPRLRWLDLGDARVSNTDLQRFLDVTPLELIVPCGRELTGEFAGVLRMLQAGSMLRALYIGHANGDGLEILLLDESLRDDLVLGVRSLDVLRPDERVRIAGRGWSVVDDGGWMEATRDITGGVVTLERE